MTLTSLVVFLEYVTRLLMVLRVFSRMDCTFVTDDFKKEFDDVEHNTKNTYEMHQPCSLVLAAKLAVKYSDSYRETPTKF